jgi:hypothetical protein
MLFYKKFMGPYLPLVLTASAHFLVGCALPGFALCRLLGSRLTRPLPIYRTLVLIAASGVAYGTLQFVFLWVLAVLLGISAAHIPLLKYAADAGFFISVLLKTKPDSFKIRPPQASETLFLCSMFLLGVLAVRHQPNILDDGQLLWTQVLLDNGVPRDLFLGATVMRSGEQAAANGSGSLGYSSLIISLGAFSPNLPLAYSASGLKAVLCLLFALTLLHLGESLGYSRKKTLLASLAAVGLSSSLFFFGILNTGKGTVWGAVFMLNFIACLLAEDGPPPPETGLFFCAALASSALAAPYLATMTLLYVLFARGKTPLRPLLYHIGFLGALPAAMTIEAVFDIPSAVSLCATTAIMAAVRFLPAQTPRAARIPISGARSAAAASLGLFFVSAALMPLATPILTEFDIAGNPIFELLSPLDGKESFIHFIAHEWRNLPLPLVYAGWMGILLFPLNKRLRRRPGLQALAVFPFAVTSAVLLLGRWKGSPLTGFNIWDMLKGIPIWYAPTILAVFFAMLLEAVDDAAKNRRVLSAAGLLLIMGLAVYHRTQDLKTLMRPALFHSLGGHPDADISALTEPLLRPGSPPQLFLDPASSGGAMDNRYFLAITTRKKTVVLRDKNDEELSNILNGGPAFIVLAPGTFDALISRNPDARKRLRNVRRLPVSRDVLLLLDDLKS